jgi:hypothetical protein
MRGYVASLIDGLTILFVIVMVGLMFMSFIYMNESGVTLVSIDDVKQTKTETKILFTIRRNGPPMKLIGVELFGDGFYLLYGSNGYQCSNPQLVKDSSLHNLCSNPPLVSFSSFYIVLSGRYDIYGIRVYLSDGNKIIAVTGYRE